MRISELWCTVLLVLCASAGAKTPYVIIDAADGGTEQEVQVALDSHPAGTKFLLRGVFNFAQPVFVEKSGTTLQGTVVDDGNGRPGPEDDWQTTIYGTHVAFELSPRDFANLPYDLDKLEISGIQFKLPIALGNNPYVDIGCGVPVAAYEATNIKFHNNYVDGGVQLHRSIRKVSIHQNYFSGTQDANPVQFLGHTRTGCFPHAIATIQFNNSITENVFSSTYNIYSGSNTGLQIRRNKMMGTPRGNNRITLYELQHSRVSNNEFYGDSTSSGIALYTRNLNPDLPGTFSNNITIDNNTFVDMVHGIRIFGGVSKLSIRRNHISQSKNFSPTGTSGIGLSDNVQNLHPVLTNSSHKVRIINNHVQDVGQSAIFLNGETSGVTAAGNSFSNHDALLGDITLAPTDFVFGADLCPAYGNKIVVKDPATVVSDFGVEVCPEDKPNRILGPGRGPKGKK